MSWANSDCGSAGLERQLEHLTLAQRLWLWGRDDLEHLARPAADVLPVVFLRALARYGLPRTRVAATAPLTHALFFCRPLWLGDPARERPFAGLFDLARRELQALYDGLFPPDAAAWCPLCSGPVHRPIDVVHRQGAYGEAGRCHWCRKWVRPVAWSRLKGGVA